MVEEIVKAPTVQSTEKVHEVHHKTEFVDKALPTIIIRDEKVEGVGKYSISVISVSDKTSKEALETLYQVKRLQNMNFKESVK